MSDNNTGFIDSKGVFEPLPAGIIHAEYRPLKKYLNGGGCRVKDYNGNLTIESPAGLNKKQHNRIIIFIAGGDYHRVYVINKGREWQITAFKKVQVWHYKKAMKSRKRDYVAKHY